MKVILTPLEPTKSAIAAGRHPVTPELNGGVSARHSRSDKGVERILEELDRDCQRDPETQVASILEFADYGHESIRQLVPGISIHMESISLYLIHYVFQLMQVGAGQERSTRYGNFSQSGVVAPQQVGIPERLRETYERHIGYCFSAYDLAVQAWTSIANKRPELMRLPDGANPKMIERLKRNFVFDRSRYFLPVSILNNMNLVTHAGEWGEIVRGLFAAPWPEAHELAHLIVGELSLICPRMLKHAGMKLDCRRAWEDEHDRWVQHGKGFRKTIRAKFDDGVYDAYEDTDNAGFESFLRVHFPFEWEKCRDGSLDMEFTRDLKNHSNRYAPIGRTLKKTAVEFGWNAVSEAEIRDMNRHRPGEKNFVQVPMGFYCAMEQLPTEQDLDKEIRALQQAEQIGTKAALYAIDRLAEGGTDHIYWANLGTQFQFSHTMTANKFLYACELRTGPGAHFRYKRHYEDVMQHWFRRFPQTKDFIKLGRGEPE